MKSLVLTGRGAIQLVKKPEPDLSRPDEVLIRVVSAGICGSDMHYFTEGGIGSQVISYPFTIGHECSGTVTRTAAEVTSLKAGDRVAVDPAMPCHVCDQCLAGRSHTCRNLRFLGCPGQSEGCYSEYIVMPASSCHKLPDNLTHDDGAMAEPFSIGLYAVRLSGGVKGKSVAILGSGPIGMSVMLAARAEGASAVYMTDLVDERLQMAREMGADMTFNAGRCDVVREILTHEPLQPDLVFECCGKQEAADQAVAMLRPGGRLVIAGIPSFPRWSLDAESMRRKEITVVNVRRQNETLDDALEMMSDGRSGAGRLVTHIFTPEQAEDAFRLVQRYGDGVMKAVIRF